MKKIIPLFIFAALLLFNACSSDNAATSVSSSSFDQQLYPVAENATFEQLDAITKKTSKSRNEDGSLKKENFPALISQTLGILQKFPGDDRSRVFAFQTAEILKVGKDFENAAKMYLRMIELFPKSNDTGNALFQLAIMQDQDMNDPKGAITNFETFVKEYPEHPANGIASQFLYRLTNK
jgi:TolA-binding protein